MDGKVKEGDAERVRGRERGRKGFDEILAVKKSKISQPADCKMPLLLSSRRYDTKQVTLHLPGASIREAGGGGTEWRAAER